MANEFVNQSLDEIRFWSRIMKEHALFLSLGFSYNDSKLIQEAQHYIDVFEKHPIHSVEITKNVLKDISKDLLEKFFKKVRSAKK